MTRPQVRFYAIITDVGPRGGDVAVSWSADPGAASGDFTAPSLAAAAVMTGELWGRLMYGADQPTDERGDPT